eukprot:TRINITY_DN31861_c0_g1_i1.p1 TRINITY_DN31861_c0_g1~~TRINITY_DN31861_c0_g1_i1.p1  ORF type:complete len:202 (+),score=10.90 TRINITY_DN31861_c0_g1_i1:60-665(+)
MDEVFGDLPSEIQLSHESFRGSQRVQPILSVPGLYVIEDFMNEEGTEYILSSALALGWATGGDNNQAMRFGDLPAWVAGVTDILDGLPGVPFPDRPTLFNQLILNRYEKAEGILPHIDLLRFQDFIFGVTLAGSASFIFADKSGPVQTIFLSRGDAYILTGPARYDFTHEIPTQAEDVDPATEETVPRSVRISLTLRALVS